MSIDSVTVQDGATTPSDVVFDRYGASPGAVQLRARGATVSADKVLTLKTTESSERTKVMAVLRVPVVQTETVNGISSPKIVRTAYFRGEFTFDGDASDEERRDILSYVETLLGSGVAEVADVLRGRTAAH